MSDELVAMAERLEKAHDIVIAGEIVAGVSNQDKEANPLSDYIIQTYVEPPLPLEKLANLSNLSAARSAIIEAIARNTVGLGYEIDVAEGHEHDEEDPSDEMKELCQLLEALSFRDQILDNPSFTELMIAVKTDEEEVGQGFLEVSRNKKTGKPDGLFHVPAKRMRRRKDREGWGLMRIGSFEDEEAKFYNFGDKVVYNDDGTPTNTLKSGRNWFTNEIISFRLYTSESRDYGLPRDVGLFLEYAGDKLAAEYNVSFFDSGGTPPTVLFVHGEPDENQGRLSFRVPQRTVERIANTIKSDGDHRDRVAIIPLPAGSKTEMHTLGQVSDKDMGFVQYRADNMMRTLSAFRVAPVFISVDTQNNRYDAEVQRSITLEQVFDPDQVRYEHKLHRTLLTDLGFQQLRVKFKRLAVEDNKSQRDSATRLGEQGIITHREYRAAHGRGPLPEAAASSTAITWTDGQEYKSVEPEPGQVPHGWNDSLCQSQKPQAGAPTVSDQMHRTLSESDQRGLKPGLAGRQQQSSDAELAAARTKNGNGNGVGY
jgi:capsid portal protein